MMHDYTAPLAEAAQSEVLALLRELVRRRSFNPPGEEAKVGEWVIEWLAEAGLNVRRQPVSGERFNVVGRLTGRGQRPALVLCAHLDTVPPGEARWSVDPLGGEVRDGRLYGRGAADTKAALAAMLIAARALRQGGAELQGDLIVLATVDEETNGLGAQAFLESGGMEGVGAIIIGEPTSLELVIAHRGALWIEITTHGKPAHGAMPEQGLNAILPMTAILRRLADHTFAHAPDQLLRPPTINIGTVQGGTKINMVPDRCQATVDIRTVPGQSHEALLAEVRQMAETVVQDWPGVRVDVRTLNDKPPLFTAASAPLIAAAQSVSVAVLEREPVLRGAPYLTDGALLAGTTGTPALICGPGQESIAHQVDEFVPLDEVFAAVRLYAGLAARLLA